jgi:hypothetical protein
MLYVLIDGKQRHAHVQIGTKSSPLFNCLLADIILVAVKQDTISLASPHLQTE